MDDVKKFLRIVGWDEQVMWPREVGLHRAKVRDAFEFFVYVERCLESRSSCYTSLFSEYSLLTGGLRKFVVDVDFHDRPVGEDELERIGIDLVERLRQYGLLAVVMTGRGLHVYFAVDPELVRWVGWQAYSRRMTNYLFGRVLEGRLNPDMQVVGDRRRMVRVAGTWNGGRMSRVLWFTESPELTITDEMREYVRREPSGGGEKEYVPDPEADKMPFPPCITEMVAELVETGELDHMGRVILASYLLNVRGWSEESVAEIFKAASDYNERITNYQVSHIRRGKYLPPSCERVWVLGYCPFVCSFWPWMGKVKRE